MKKANTVKETAQKSTREDMREIIDNQNAFDENIDLLDTAQYRFYVLFYSELKKALDGKDCTVYLNCNYENSKKSTLNIDYYRIALKYCTLQVYCKRAYVDIVITSKKDIIAQIDKLNAEYEAQTVHKATVFKRVQYDDIVQLVKSLKAFFEIAYTVAAETPAETETASAK